MLKRAYLGIAVVLVAGLIGIGSASSASAHWAYTPYGYCGHRNHTNLLHGALVYGGHSSPTTHLVYQKLRSGKYRVFHVPCPAH